MQQIDFLPASYHQRRQRRQRRVFFRGVLLACLGLISVATFQQRRTRNQLMERRDRLQSQAQRMVEQLGDAEGLRQQIERLETRANLVTALRMQARPTRLLAAVTESLPRFVSLTELSLAPGPIESTARAEVRTAGEAEESLTPQQRDLERLTQDIRQTAQFMSIQGIAPDDVAISDYLAALMATRVFDDVKLLYTDQFRHREHRLRNFGIRARIRRPGTESTTLAAMGSRR